MVCHVVTGIGRKVFVSFEACSGLVGIFSSLILSLPLIQEGLLSVSGERMCTSAG